MAIAQNHPKYEKLTRLALQVPVGALLGRHQRLHLVAVVNLVHAYAPRAYQLLLDFREISRVALVVLVAERRLRTLFDAHLRRGAAIYGDERIDALLQIEEHEERLAEHLAIDAALQTLRVGRHQDAIDVAMCVRWR